MSPCPSNLLIKMHWICFSPTQKDKVINYRNCLSAKCKIARESFDGLAKKEKKWRKEESQNKGKLREWNMKSLFMKDFLFVIWNISWKRCSHFKSKEMLPNKYICKLPFKIKGINHYIAFARIFPHEKDDLASRIPGRFVGGWEDTGGRGREDLRLHSESRTSIPV